MARDAIQKETLRRKLLKRWWALWVIFAVLWLYPVSNVTLRLASIACAVLLGIGCVSFTWTVKWLRWTILVVGTSLAIAIVLPGRTIEETSLRDAYVRSLRRYIGTRYVWGGENSIGIDCSGLVRAALINADFAEGLRTFNPALFRAGIGLWWNDCSARAIGEGYHGQTSFLFEIPSLSDMDYSNLKPGDLAITGDGIHILAYLDQNSWIQADPREHRVVITTIPTNDPWLNSRAQVVRWQQLGSAR
jgi:hypothetical protein